MANTYTSIYVHLVFAVKLREAKLIATFRNRVYQYLTRVARNAGHTPIAIGGTDNHIHMLIGYNILQPIPELVRDLKTASSKFINEQHLLNCRFEWQRGYGAFSHSRRELDDIIRYITSQPQHHIQMTLEQEMRMILDRFGIDYNPDFILSDPD